MKNKYRNYSDQDIIDACKISVAYSEVLRKLDLVCAGGNYNQLQKNIDRLKIDISHFKHQASNQGKEFKKYEDLTGKSAIKNRILKLRGHQCEKCLRKKWFKKLIPIEIHHIDGNQRNNVKTNLQLLCPNCHAQTDDYRRRDK